MYLIMLFGPRLWKRRAAKFLKEHYHVEVDTTEDQDLIHLAHACISFDDAYTNKLVISLQEETTQHTLHDWRDVLHPSSHLLPEDLAKGTWTLTARESGYKIDTWILYNLGESFEPLQITKPYAELLALQSALHTQSQVLNSSHHKDIASYQETIDDYRHKIVLVQQSMQRRLALLLREFHV